MRDGLRGPVQAFGSERHPQLGLWKGRVQFRSLLESRQGLIETLLLELELPEIEVGNGQLGVKGKRLLELLFGLGGLIDQRERPPVIEVGAAMLGLERHRLGKLLEGRLRLIQLDQQNSQVEARFKQVRLQFEGFLISFHRLVVLVQTRIGVSEVEPGRNQVRLALDDGLQGSGGGGKILAIERLFGGVQKHR